MKDPITTTIFFNGREHRVTETAIVSPPVIGGEYAPGTTIRFTRISPGGLIVRELYRIDEGS